MKSSFAAIAFFALTLPCHAGSVTISDQSTALPAVARETVTILVNAGLPIKQTGKNLFTVAVSALHCQAQSNEALDASAPQAGLETYSCRINSENSFGTSKGQPFAEAGVIREVLAAIEDKMGDKVTLTDHAMGKSNTFAKLISCVIHADVENFDNGGRWACSFTDGQ
jgi:hypothetical protein